MTLTPESTQNIEDKVRSGQYHSANEVVREGLRLLEERDQLRQVRLEQLRQDIAVGIAQADAGGATSLSMDAIKSERRRLFGERNRLAQRLT